MNIRKNSRKPRRPFIYFVIAVNRKSTFGRKAISTPQLLESSKFIISVTEIMKGAIAAH